MGTSSHPLPQNHRMTDMRGRMGNDGLPVDACLAGGGSFFQTNGGGAAVGIETLDAGELLND